MWIWKKSIISCVITKQLSPLKYKCNSCYLVLFMWKKTFFFFLSSECRHTGKRIHNRYLFTTEFPTIKSLRCLLKNNRFKNTNPKNFWHHAFLVITILENTFLNIKNKKHAEVVNSSIGTSIVSFERSLNNIVTTRLLV